MGHPVVVKDILSMLLFFKVSRESPGSRRCTLDIHVVQLGTRELHPMAMEQRDSMDTILCGCVRWRSVSSLTEYSILNIRGYVHNCSGSVLIYVRKVQVDDQLWSVHVYNKLLVVKL